MPLSANNPSRQNEAGHTLVEVLVVVGMLSAVFSALMMPLITTQRTTSRDLNYAYAQQSARTGLDSMVAQVRAAYNILDTSGNSIDFDVWLSGVAYRVYYECDLPQAGTSYHECIRVQAAAGSALPSLSSGKTVVQYLTNGTSSDPVFSFAPDPEAPYYMTATVKVPASNGVHGGLAHTIAFSDGALMRNENVAN